MGEPSMEFAPFMPDRERALRWREHFDIEIARLLEVGWTRLWPRRVHDITDDYCDEP